VCLCVYVCACVCVCLPLPKLCLIAPPNARQALRLTDVLDPTTAHCTCFVPSDAAVNEYARTDPAAASYLDSPAGEGAGVEALGGPG